MNNQHSACGDVFFNTALGGVSQYGNPDNYDINDKYVRSFSESILAQEIGIPRSYKQPIYGARGRSATEAMILDAQNSQKLRGMQREIDQDMYNASLAACKEQHEKFEAYKEFCAGFESSADYRERNARLNGVTTEAEAPKEVFQDRPRSIEI